MNIIELAKEAGYQEGRPMARLERFAALVRAEREWVDLTDDEIHAIRSKTSSEVNFSRAVIAAFKEKNK